MHWRGEKDNCPRKLVKSKYLESVFNDVGGGEAEGNDGKFFKTICVFNWDFAILNTLLS